MRTLRTSLTGIFRVNGNHRNTRQFCFVLNHRSQLSERPVVQFGSDFAANPDPQADVLQVFQNNRLFRVLRGLNYLFTDRVILLSGKPAFFARTLFQKTDCRLRAFALQSGANLPAPLSQVAHVCAGVTPAIAVSGNSGNPEVNAEKAFRVAIGQWLNHIAGSEEEPFALAENEIGFTLPAVEQLSLLPPTGEGDFLTPGDCPDRNVSRVVPENPVIISNRTIGAKTALSALVQLVGIRNLCNHPDDNLCRQSKRLPDQSVRKFVEAELAESFRIPRQTRAFIRGKVGQADRFPERDGLFFRGMQFYTCGQLHGAILIQSFQLETVNCAALQA